MKRRAVLLIDDDPAIHQLVEHYLAGIVDEFWAASTGRQGLALARENQPTLILLDIGLPDLRGTEVLRELRASTATKGISVLFLTAKDDSRSMVGGLEAGAVDYITKPFDGPVFQARVRSALKRGDSRQHPKLESVLVVDDDPHICRLISFYLKNIATVHHAYDAKVALESARRLRPSVILLDLNLPDRHGFEVCRELLSEPETANIPVVILSADTGNSRMAAGLDRGAVDYVQKPIVKEVLVARVRAAVRRKSRTT